MDARERFTQIKGGNLKVNVSKKKCRLLQINKNRTTPYHPRSDGMIEHLNKAVKHIWADKHVLQSVKRIGTDTLTEMRWHTAVLHMKQQGLLHTEWCLEQKLLFHWSLIVSDRIQEGEGENVFISESEYVRNFDNELDFIHQVTRETFGKSTQRPKIQYDRKVHERTYMYDIRDLVRRYQKNVRVGIKEKLSRNWTRPWVFVQRFSDICMRFVFRRTQSLLSLSC